MVTTARSKRRLTSLPTEPRLICCSGLPSVGTSTFVNLLAGSSEEKTLVIDDLDDEAIELAFEIGVKVVFLDPFEPSVEAVQHLFDKGYATQADPGCLIRFWDVDEAILRRAYAAGRHEITRDYLDKQRFEYAPVEERIRALNLRYYTVPVDRDIASTAAAFARRIGLLK